jgi:hypothetical protein
MLGGDETILADKDEMSGEKREGQGEREQCHNYIRMTLTMT